ncbi:outer membrane lipid asymmetry maintenance protein MlaD [Sphingomonas quercus]|uniref:Outer membrane lipid asymmetry maintenance protein MlaD n=1 Tax=Sphingomonas quercus TaxID=2842451 RepID=A0ABS6BNV8_9SPHN|nr:outer membrane lipid asymmetry maintenance protein MlaD [Sphingomonas quercus]MBU3078939.1 outer membrane lipid asymmetry maintenance protein MlaD [Sphingomonas quercus]
MRGVFRENLTEALVGFVVVALALWFAVFAWQRTGGGGATSAVHVTALFPNATGVSVGTDVRIAGLKVGTVSTQRLDPKTWQAEVVLALDPSTKVPADSTAVITSEGLLGGTYIQLVPGADQVALKEGDMIVDTQGSLDLMSLIGQFINRTGSGDDKSGGAAAGGSGTMGTAPAPGK